MTSKRILRCLLLSILAITPLSAWENTQILRDVPLQDYGLIRWTRESSEDQINLSVQRFDKEGILWTRNIECNELDGNVEREIPIEAYLVDKEIITFPLTLRDDKGTVYRRQICLNFEDGSLMWDKRIPAGLNQRFFYSMTDGKKLLLHNLHEFRGPELLCLDVQSGEELWLSRGPVQPALALQTEEYFILHNSRLNRYSIINKENGEVTGGETDSPIRIWQDQLLISKRESDRVDLFVWSAGQETSLCSIAGNFPEESINHFSINMQGFSASQGKILPFFIYEDTIILQEEISSDHYRLRACSLTEQGRTIWTHNLKGHKRLDMEQMGWDSRVLDYLYDGSLLLNHPEKTLFYQQNAAIFPLLISTEESEQTSLILLNLVSGKKIYQQNETHYSFQYTLMSDSDWHYLFFTGPDEEETLLLQLSKLTGNISAGLLFPKENFDADYAKVSPFYSILHGVADRLDFAEEGAWEEPYRKWIQLD